MLETLPEYLSNSELARSKGWRETFCSVLRVSKVPINFGENSMSGLHLSWENSGPKRLAWFLCGQGCTVSLTREELAAFCRAGQA